MRAAKTHFEQIPVEVVKKIAQEPFPEVKEIRNNHVIVKVPAKKLGPIPRGNIRVTENGIEPEIRLSLPHACGVCKGGIRTEATKLADPPDRPRPCRRRLTETRSGRVRSAGPAGSPWPSA